jgi:hypothetical protein
MRRLDRTDRDPRLGRHLPAMRRSPMDGDQQDNHPDGEHGGQHQSQGSVSP